MLLFELIPGIIAAWIAWKRGATKWPDKVDRAKSAFVCGVITSVVWTVILFSNFNLR